MLLFYFVFLPHLSTLFSSRTVLNCLIPSDSTFESHSIPSLEEYCLFVSFSVAFWSRAKLFTGTENQSDSLFSSYFFFLLDNLGGYYSFLCWNMVVFEYWADLQNFKEGKPDLKREKIDFSGYQWSSPACRFYRLVPCWWKKQIGTLFFRELVKCVAFCESSGIKVSFRFEVSLYFQHFTS